MLTKTVVCTDVDAAWRLAARLFQDDLIEDQGVGAFVRPPLHLFFSAFHCTGAACNVSSMRAHKSGATAGSMDTTGSDCTVGRT
eukprot:SAG11_NODE_13653_length_645_cov_1.045788_1_plen_83_part_10